MANKYLYNVSGIEKTYLGVPIPNNTFYQIPANMLIKFQNDNSVLSDILTGLLKISSNGTSKYSDNNVTNLNFLKGEHYEVDSEGRQVNRIAAASKGWTYLSDNITIETSKLNGLDSEDYLGNAVGGITLKFFNSSNVELTTQEDIDASCVKTELIVAPPHDYEIMGGTMRQLTRPTTKIKLWTIGGVLELGVNGVKEMIRNLDLRSLSPDDHIKTDGRASKYMRKDLVGIPYQGNQLKFILKHQAGVKHELFINIEYFRA